MARKVMEELHDMMKPTPEVEEISDRLLQKEIHERKVRDYFTEVIYTYLRKNHKGMGQLDKEDLEKMTAGLNTVQKQLFTEQVFKAMKTNRGKSLKWIKENNKSVLLNQIDD